MLVPGSGFTFLGAKHSWWQPHSLLLVTFILVSQSCRVLSLILGFFFPSVEVHCIDVCNEDKVHFQFLDLNSLLLLLSPLWHIVNVSHRAQQHTKNWHGSKHRLVCLFPSNVAQLSHLHFCGWSMQSYSSASCFLRHYCAVACRVLASAVQFYLCCCVKLTYLLCWLGWYDGRHIKKKKKNRTLIIS